MSNHKVLVTGASGFLGRRTVEMLVERDFIVRALVRKSSKVGDLKRTGVEVCYGDVTDIQSLKPAFEGVDFVVHAAADNSGTEEGARRITIGGTHNVLELCAALPVRKLVYISSCSVYGPADSEVGQVIDESAPLERYPERRGVYSWAKLEAEKLVLNYMTRGKAAITCLRPGTIYGPGGENYTPMMGFSLANRVFVVIRNDEFTLPLVYLDNLVYAIFLAVVQDRSAGQVYNVVDPQQVDKKQYMDFLIRKIHPQAWFLFLPYNLLAAVVYLQEQLFNIVRIKPLLSNYRLVSSQKPIIYDSSKIMIDLDWQPSVSFVEAIDKIYDRQIKTSNIN